MRNSIFADLKLRTTALQTPNNKEIAQILATISTRLASWENITIDAELAEHEEKIDYPKLTEERKQKKLLLEQKQIERNALYLEFLPNRRASGPVIILPDHIQIKERECNALLGETNDLRLAIKKYKEIKKLRRYYQETYQQLVTKACSNDLWDELCGSIADNFGLNAEKNKFYSRYQSALIKYQADSSATNKNRLRQRALSLIFCLTEYKQMLAEDLLPAALIEKQLAVDSDIQAIRKANNLSATDELNAEEKQSLAAYFAKIHSLRKILKNSQSPYRVWVKNALSYAHIATGTLIVLAAKIKELINHISEELARLDNPVFGRPKPIIFNERQRQLLNSIVAELEKGFKRIVNHLVEQEVATYSHLTDNLLSKSLAILFNNPAMRSLPVNILQTMLKSLSVFLLKITVYVNTASSQQRKKFISDQNIPDYNQRLQQYSFVDKTNAQLLQALDVKENVFFEALLNKKDDEAAREKLKSEVINALTMPIYNREPAFIAVKAAHDEARKKFEELLSQARQELKLPDADLIQLAEGFSRQNQDENGQQLTSAHTAFIRTEAAFHIKQYETYILAIQSGHRFGYAALLLYASIAKISVHAWKRNPDNKRMLDLHTSAHHLALAHEIHILITDNDLDFVLLPAKPDVAPITDEAYFANFDALQLAPVDEDNAELLRSYSGLASPVAAELSPAIELQPLQPAASFSNVLSISRQSVLGAEKLGLQARLTAFFQPANDPITTCFIEDIDEYLSDISNRDIKDNQKIEIRKQLLQLLDQALLATREDKFYPRMHAVYLWMERRLQIASPCNHHIIGSKLFDIIQARLRKISQQENMKPTNDLEKAIFTAHQYNTKAEMLLKRQLPKDRDFALQRVQADLHEYLLGLYSRKIRSDDTLETRRIILTKLADAFESAQTSNHDGAIREAYRSAEELMRSKQIFVARRSELYRIVKRTLDDIREQRLPLRHEAYAGKHEKTVTPAEVNPHHFVNNWVIGPSTLEQKYDPATGNAVQPASR